MPHVELLIAIAIVSILLAGFASVVMLTIGDADGLPGVARTRLGNLIVLCFVNALFALLPALLAAITGEVDIALRMAQLLFAVALAAIVALRLLPSLRHAGTGAARAMFVSLTGIFFVAILLQIFSAAGAPLLSVAGSYLAGLTLILLVCGVTYYRLIMGSRVDDLEEIFAEDD